MDADAPTRQRTIGGVGHADPAVAPLSHATGAPDAVASPVTAPPARQLPAGLRRWLRPVVFLAVLFIFFLSLDLLGQAFGLFGKGIAAVLIEQTRNPFVGLFAGVLATALAQSSSTTTSLTVALVAAGGLTVEGAIPIIMGANIGTSVTNTLVSLAHVTRKGEFERAFAGATVHDFFNLLTVCLMFPLELATGALAKSAMLLGGALDGVGGLRLLDPIKLVVHPVALTLVDLVGRSPVVTLIGALGLLFLSLKLLVDLLKAALSSRTERLLHETLFRSPLRAFTAGLVMTVMVQSSSITTSVMVPLVAAGVVTLEHVFPFTVGANIGTTVTALIAALSTGSVAAVTVAFSHLLFNVFGTLVLYVPRPMRGISLGLSRGLARLAVRNRLVAVAYVLVVFFVIPFLMIFLSGGW
jgi:solute carrier family 34 (sodium-dependent phosphate cotransporter)